MSSTPHAAAALEPVAAAVAACFARTGDDLARRPGVVALSGGADSTALLLALADRARRTGTALVAAHLDHGLDPDAPRRARAAAALARRLGVACEVSRHPPAAPRRPGESAEAAARRRRYAFLTAVARRHGAGWVATGHHRDDQAETVVLRLLYGSGLAGLAGIAPRRPLVPGVLLLRPLLGLGRRELEAAAAAAGLAAVRDPTNGDLAVPRNRVRHLLLPALRAAAAGGAPLDHRLARLAAAARGAGAALDATLTRRLAPRPLADGASVDLSALADLPPALLAPALALLHRAVGLAYPPPAAAVAELERQLAARRRHGGAVGCCCGGAWRWAVRGDRLALLRRRERAAAPAAFSYTLRVPGELEIRELGLRVRLRRAAIAPWMFRGAPDRAGLDLPLAPGDTVTVRSRRPGDRLHPLGAAGSRRLKEVLIDRRVPRRRRGLLPLVCLGARGERIAWVPGVTVDESFRLPAPSREGGAVWVAEMVSR